MAARGGIFGDLPTKKYDAGGMLQPGLTLAYNATGKPEPVFTSGQWVKLLEAHANGARLPEYVTLVDEHGELLGRMRVEARIEAARVKVYEGAGG